MFDDRWSFGLVVDGLFNEVVLGDLDACLEVAKVGEHGVEVVVVGSGC